jgi:hypothetical protein
MKFSELVEVLKSKEKDTKQQTKNKQQSERTNKTTKQG